MRANTTSIWYCTVRLYRRAGWSTRGPWDSTTIQCSYFISVRERHAATKIGIDTRTGRDKPPTHNLGECTTAHVDGLSIAWAYFPHEGEPRTALETCPTQHTYFVFAARWCVPFPPIGSSIDEAVKNQSTASRQGQKLCTVVVVLILLFTIQTPVHMNKIDYSASTTSSLVVANILWERNFFAPTSHTWRAHIRRPLRFFFLSGLCFGRWRCDN